MAADSDKHPPDAEATALLNAVGPAFSRLRRSVLLDVANPVSRKDMSRARVLNIVREGAHESAQGITVGVVAERLTVDPSVASRMVSDCIGAGYLRRAASQTDGRRTLLELTDDGVAMLARFRERQREAFEYITRTWEPAERLEFARLLLKYVDAVSRLRVEATAAPEGSATI